MFRSLKTIKSHSLLIFISLFLVVGCSSTGGKKEPSVLYQFYHEGSMAKTPSDLSKDGKFYISNPKKTKWLAGYALKEGTYELPEIVPNSGVYGWSLGSGMEPTRIVGRGPGKTIVKGEITTDMHEIHFMNMTLVNPTIHKRSQGGKITFFNVEVIGQIKTEVEKGTRVRDEKERKRPSRIINFVLSDFHEEQKMEKQKYREGDEYPIFIRHSRLRKGDSFVNYPSTKQSPDQLASLTNLTAEAHRPFVPGSTDGAPKWVFGEKKVDSQALNQAIAKAEKELQRKNFLVAELFAQKADEINFKRKDEKISGLKRKIQTAFDNEYSCKITSKRMTSNVRDTGNSYATTKALEELAKKTFPQIGQFLTNSDQTKNCRIVALLKKDLRKFKKGKQTLVSSKPIYEESAASKMRKAQAAKAREAAKEAQWKAAMERTNALVNNMTAQAKFNHQNRNRIENRSGGTYLVLNNKTYKPSPSLSYNSAMKNAMNAQKTYVQNGTEYVLKGYEMQVKYNVDYGEELDGKLEFFADGKKKTFDLPKINTSFRKTCQKMKNTATRREKSIGSCDTTSKRVEDRTFALNKKLGKSYSQLVEQVKRNVKKSFEQKMRSSDAATKLEGQLLASRYEGVTKVEKKLKEKVLN